jgi:hypothetical protein
MLPRQRSSVLYRAAAAAVRAHALGVPVPEAARAMYGRDRDDLLDVVLRAASSPASLTVPAWAGQLGQQLIASELVQSITALSAAASLMARGLKLDLTGRSQVSVPGRRYDPQMAGDWIAEGAPIPVRGGTVVPGPQLQPRKLAVITAYTREMVEADSIELFTKTAIREAAAALLDLKMFSSDAGGATAPPGILIGATNVSPSTADAPWAISSDIGALVQALAEYGGGLEPVIIAAPGQAASLRMWRQQDFYDIYASLALPAGTVCAVEASSFASAFDGLPQFETSTGATIHMEDTAPADITNGGVATPVMSAFQVDMIGLRMILRASWGLRNVKHVAIIEGTNW